MADEAVATEAYRDSVLVDSWRCSICGGSTYDDARQEIPTHCCRCGAKFSKHFYRKDKDAIHNQTRIP